jgi:hypothetical protein
MCERTDRIQEEARMVLVRMALLVRAARDDGRVTELRLLWVLNDMIGLLHQMGGFGEAIRLYERAEANMHERAAKGSGRPDPPPTDRRVQAHVLQEALKFAARDEGPLLEHVDDLYRFAMKMLRELGCAH